MQFNLFSCSEMHHLRAIKNTDGVVCYQIDPMMPQSEFLLLFEINFSL